MSYKNERPSYITASNRSYTLIKPARDNLKNNMTKAEIVLWKRVRRGRLGHKFRRQQIIDRFVVDFIPLSGTERLNGFGYKVLRFTNNEVTNNIERVIRTIKDKLKSSPYGEETFCR